ncbi:MAG: gluconate:H+ symporter [Planctomycetota bacterium]
MFPIIRTFLDTQLLVCALAAIVGIVVLIGRFNLNSILALAIAALGMGLSAGMNPAVIAKSFETGVGNVLGFVSGVIALGAILGKMLGESGGAEVVAGRIANVFGPTRAEWAILAAAIAIGLAVFFPVGFMLLLPIVFAVARTNSIPLMKLGIPLVAGLSAMHACVPPHPGPMIVIDQLKAHAGKTILYSLIVAIPMAVLAGPVYGNWILKRIRIDGVIPGADVQAKKATTNPPGFGITLATIFLPIVLMVLAGWADVKLPRESVVRQWCDFFGGPLVSMLIAVLVSFYTFGSARGMSSSDILKHSNDCLGPLAAMLLVVGAGGGFNQVLKDCGVAASIVRFAESAKLPLLVLGWAVAAVIRVAVGSSTVAITTALGIVGPLALAQGGVNLELLAVALGAGSLFFSHVNDGGFWIVKEFFGISVSQTFKTWSVGTVIGSVAGLGLTLLLQAIV